MVRGGSGERRDGGLLAVDISMLSSLSGYHSDVLYLGKPLLEDPRVIYCPSLIMILRLTGLQGPFPVMKKSSNSRLIDP